MTTVSLEISPCYFCKTVPVLQPMMDEGTLTAFVISCEKCNHEGIYKHVREHLKEATHIAITDWNMLQKIFEGRANAIMDKIGI